MLTKRLTSYTIVALKLRGKFYHLRNLQKERCPSVVLESGAWAYKPPKSNMGPKLYKTLHMALALSSWLEKNVVASNRNLVDTLDHSLFFSPETKRR